LRISKRVKWNAPPFIQSETVNNCLDGIVWGLR